MIRVSEIDIPLLRLYKQINLYMKKIFYSLFMVAALAVSTSVMANDDTKKEGDCKAKTEACEKKEKASCCDKKKEKAASCSEKKDKASCPTEKTAEESKSCGKK